MDEGETSVEGAAASWPEGWYADAQKRHPERWWDGTRWTEHVRDGVGRPAVDVIGASPTSGGRTVTTLRSVKPALAERAAGLGARATSSVTSRVTLTGEGSVVERVRGTSQTLAGKFLDPTRRAVVLTSVSPVLQAAADGAGLRNKKGKVKVWRLMRAAARPRNTIKAATKEGGRVAASQVVGASVAAADRALTARVGAVGRTDAEIAAEWAGIDPSTAVDAMYEGLARVEASAADDRMELRSSAALMCCGLAHCLVGVPLVGVEDDIVLAVGKTLSASLLGNDRTTWTDADERHVRLALAVARRYGVQPEEVGGNGELDELFEEPHDRMAMAMAIAPGEWSCDLAAWFAAVDDAPR